MREDISTRLRGISAALLFVLLTSSASAQSDEVLCSPFRTIVIALSGQYLTAADIAALNALAAQTPQACDRVHQSIAQRLEAAARQSQWQAVNEEGQIIVVEPPAPMSWAVTRSTFGGVLTAEMMEARPSQEDINSLHPRRARERNQVGAVVLEGRVTSNGSLVWRVEDESPIGWGFGEAAIRAAALFRAPSMYEGRPTVGASFSTAIAFTASPLRVVPYE